MDAIDLARIQFAFTAAFHFIFPAVSIGLGLLVAVAEIDPLANEVGDLGPAGALLDEGLCAHLCRGCGHRHRDGVPVRHQLVALLDLRGRHLRFAAGRRGHLRLLPRVDLPGRAAVGPQPRGLGAAHGVSRAGIARRDPVRLLDHRRQLVDADPRGLPDTGRQGRPDRLHGGRRSTLRPCSASRTPSSRRGRLPRS